jgi:hypothetical protein
MFEHLPAYSRISTDLIRENPPHQRHPCSIKSLMCPNVSKCAYCAILMLDFLNHIRHNRSQ